MNALARTDYAAWSLSEAVVSDFVRKGAHLFDDRLDPRGCTDLLAQIRATRRFDESLFLDEAEVQADPPGPDLRAGAGLLERLEPKLGFIERAPQVVEALWSLLGPDYRVLDRTVACALPAGAIPAWVRRRLHAWPAAELAAFIRPEHRDIAFSHGVAFHQDLPGREGAGETDGDADVVTLHVHLHPVSDQDAPPQLLEGSHRLGRSGRPADLKRTGPDSWRYRNGRFGEMYLTERALVGETGFAALWHACTLHGAAPATGGQPRISLRYRIGRGEAAAAGIDAVNATLAGPNDAPPPGGLSRRD
jgi:hypothetical protein